MRHKNQKTPDLYRRLRKLRAADRPLYMNVPSPAPCHFTVAATGKQSVWGLRIIACSSISTVASFPKFVNTQEVGPHFRVAGYHGGAKSLTRSVILLLWRRFGETP